MLKTTNEKLVDAVLAHLTTFCPRSGAEAISYLHRTLQQDGWRGLGCLADFRSLLVELGFTVREGRNDRGQRRIEVTL